MIFDRYFAEVHRYAERRLGTDAADEIASDTFLVAFGKRDRYRAERLTARPWLYEIATELTRALAGLSNGERDVPLL